MCAEEESEGDVKNVYDETGTFMASGSGYGTKSLYEHQKETKNEYNADDLSGCQLAFCDAWDIKIRGRKKL